MKAILHGINQLDDIHIEKIPTDKVNVKGLIKTCEANLDKQFSHEWRDNYKLISAMYKQLFSEEELNPKYREILSYEVFEMAQECLEGADEIPDIMHVPSSSSGRDYYYEFARSLGVEKQISELPEYLDPDCDFV